MRRNGDVKLSSIDEIRSKFVVDKVPEKNGREENKNITNIEISKLVAFRKGQPFSMYDKNKKRRRKKA